MKIDDAPFTTRRRFIRNALATVAAVSAGIGLTSALAQAKKLKQKLVKYQDEPKFKRKCDECKFWVADDKKECEIVEGEISPNGWCIRWAKKPS